MLLDQQTRAIIWAQYRSLFNRFPRNRGGAVLAWFFSILWHAIFAFLGVLAAYVLPEVTDRSILTRSLDFGLLAALMYWQLMPLMMATSGLSLDLKRLLVYPIPERRMFGIEVLLRASTGIEILLVMTGAAIGLWRNPSVPWWGPLWFLPFTAFNLCLSAGVRDLLTRLLRKRGVREVVVLGLLLLTQLPNILVRTIPSEKLVAYLKNYAAFSAVLPLPWQWTARLASGQLSASAFFGLALWLFLGAWFGYSQFRRGLRFDEAAAESANRKQTGPPGPPLIRRAHRRIAAALPARAPGHARSEGAAHAAPRAPLPHPLPDGRLLQPHHLAALSLQARRRRRQHRLPAAELPDHRRSLLDAAAHRAAVRQRLRL